MPPAEQTDRLHLLRAGYERAALRYVCERNIYLGKTQKCTETIWDYKEIIKYMSINIHLLIIYQPTIMPVVCYLCAACVQYMCVLLYMLCVSEKSNLFLKDPTDLMTNMYGDTLVTTNGKHTQHRALG